MKQFDVDNFFKEKLTNLQPEFNEHAWDDLEKRLDNQEDHETVVAWWRWGKVAAVFVVGFLGYLSYSYYTGNQTDKFDSYAQSFLPFVIESSPKEIKTVEPVESEKVMNKIQQASLNPHTSSKVYKGKRQLVKLERSKNTNKEVAALNFDRKLKEKNFEPESSEDIKESLASFSLDSHWVASPDEPMSRENVRGQHTFGVAFSPIINPQGLQAGIGYTHEVAISEKTSVLSGLNYTPWASNLPTFDANGISAPTKVKLNTLEIPLEAKVKVGKNVAVSGGVSNTILLKETIGNVVNNNAEWNISSINVGVSYDIKISKHSQLNLQPYYRIPLQSVGLSGTQISGFGLRTGFSYNTR